MAIRKWKRLVSGAGAKYNRWAWKWARADDGGDEAFMNSERLSPSVDAFPGRRRMRWYLRMPLKGSIFSAVTFLVLFPDPCRFARHLTHVRNLERMVTPDAPELARWDAELQDRLKTQRSKLHA